MSGSIASDQGEIPGQHIRSTLYQQSADEVVTALHTDRKKGLSTSESRARLAQFGRNELKSDDPVPAWRKFLGQFSNILVVVLLIATAISAGLWFIERESTLPYEAMSAGF